MVDREKVIRALERCLKHTCSRPNSKEYEECEYTTGLYCRQDKVMFDALELLKAQEPRVMTLEEAKSVEGYVWVEICDTPILEVSLFHNGYYLERFEEPFPVDSMNWIDYNQSWRYWTNCPTDEQRMAVKWNGI